MSYYSYELGAGILLCTFIVSRTCATGFKMFADIQSRVKSPQTFTERVEHLLEHVQYRRMESEGELEAVLRLRYNAYLKEGAITPNDSQKLEDAFDEGDNVYNIGIFIDGELASALRLHTIFHAEQESPAMESFSEFLIPELKAGRLIVDPNRFVANYALARLYPELPYVTLRPTHLACVHFGIDLVTMTVRGEHHAFYRRGFFANPVCPPRPYPLLSKPIGLLFVDFSKDAERILRRHPYWDSSEAERQSLFGRGPTCVCSRERSTTTASGEPLEGVRTLISEGLRTSVTLSPPIAAAR